MPKFKQYEKLEGGLVRELKRPGKNKIGGRKSGKTAEHMSTDELQKIAIRAECARDRAMIERVLNARQKAIL